MVFKNSNKVRIKDGDIYVYGFVTIPTEKEAKVLFEFPDTGLSYWYYKNEELELVSDEEYEKLKQAYLAGL